MVTVLDVLKRSKDLCGKVCSITCDAACCEGSLVPEYEANRVSELIDAMPSTIGQISDGYHTFDELYEHRYELWLALCRVSSQFSNRDVWRCVYNADGSSYEGYFLLGIDLIGELPRKQLSYHLPMKYWNACDFAFTHASPYTYDGHTSADVLERLRSL